MRFDISNNLKKKNDIFIALLNRLSKPIGDSAVATASKVPAANDFFATFMKDFTAKEEIYSTIVTKETGHGTFLLTSKRNRAQVFVMGHD